MATRGSLGGLAGATAGLVRLFGAAGWDVVIVETVGVGPGGSRDRNGSRISRLVVLAPGMGDDMQAFKAGIMEIADIFVINKADHPGAAQVEHEIRGLQSVGHRPMAGCRRSCARWRPKAPAWMNLMAAIENARVRCESKRGRLLRSAAASIIWESRCKSIDSGAQVLCGTARDGGQPRAKRWRRRK